MDIAALKNQGAGLARGGLWFGAGWVVGKGIVDGDTAVGIVGGLLTLLGGGFSMLANSNSSIVQAASQVPEVKAMAIADAKLAEAAKKADPMTEVKVVPQPKESS